MANASAALVRASATAIIGLVGRWFQTVGGVLTGHVERSGAHHSICTQQSALWRFPAGAAPFG